LVEKTLDELIWIILDFINVPEKLEGEKENISDLSESFVK